MRIIGLILNCDEIPELTKKDQEHLIKEAMLDYFVQNGYYREPLI